MQIITLYKYERENGGITVSPKKPRVSYTEMYRLIAEEGKVLTNDITTTTCTDIAKEDILMWREIEAPKEEEITQN